MIKFLMIESFVMNSKTNDLGNKFRDIEFIRRFQDTSFIQRSLDTKEHYGIQGIIYDNSLAELNPENYKHLPLKGLETIKLIKGIERTSSLIKQLNLREEDLTKLAEFYKNMPVFILCNNGIINSFYDNIIHKYEEAKKSNLITNYGEIYTGLGVLNPVLVDFINSR